MQAARGVPLGERHTRFTVMSNPPQSLEQILAAFQRDKEVRRRGFISGQNHARGVIARGEREYRDPGPADDVCRFLRNQGILVAEMGGGFWYDELRATYILRCCTERTNPSPPIGTNQERIQAIKARRAAQARALLGGDTELPEGDPATPAPVSGVAPIHSSNVLHVLFLTKVEYCVWALIESQVREAGEELLLIPPEDSPKCATDEFATAVTRFQASGIISVVRAEDGIYRLEKSLRLFQVYEFEDGRPVVPVTKDQLDVIRAIQDGEFECAHLPRSGVKHAFRAWAKKFRPSMDLTGLFGKISCHSAEQVEASWAILIRPSDSRQLLISHREFELYEFRVTPDPAQGSASGGVKDELPSAPRVPMKPLELTVIFYTAEQLVRLDPDHLERYRRSLEELGAKLEEQRRLTEAAARQARAAGTAH
jgi:hypothetical protein